MGVGQNFMYRNEKDRTGRASKAGALAEDCFKNSIDGFFDSDIHLTGVDNGQFDAIDFKCNLKMNIDVKSRKDPSSIWIEFKNINGYDGWLYGRATHFAFEREHDFIIVSKLDLIRLVNEIVDKNTIVDSPADCMYKMYSRKKYGREDLLTKIRPDDLTGIPHMTISKQVARSEDSSLFL